MSTRILTYTALYPSVSRPQHGIFIETRLRQLIAREGIAARVVAPVPWFPSTNPRFGARAKMAATPQEDLRFDIKVSYPRYPLIPKFGMNSAPALQAHFSQKKILREVADFAPQVLDAHYFYPDGVAAAMHANATKLPLVISARGSDINLIGQFPKQRAMMLRAAHEARALIAVSQSLRDAMTALGMPAEKIHVLRNGIDGERFAMMPQETARNALGIPLAAKVVACVGNLVAEKGSDLALEAISALPENVFAIFAGDGSLRAALEARARERGCAARVRFLGSVPQAQLPTIYSAADALLLASKREGWPNVVLEAMVCGTPVVSTGVGAVGEIITDDAVGRIVETHSAEALRTALAAQFAAHADRERIRAHALTYDWASVTRAQAALYADVAAGR